MRPQQSGKFVKIWPLHELGGSNHSKALGRPGVWTVLRVATVRAVNDWDGLGFERESSRAGARTESLPNERSVTRKADGGSGSGWMDAGCFVLG